jgi:hypothetical protein
MKQILMIVAVVMGQSVLSADEVGHHVAHDPDNNTPFANLFVPLAQRMGLEIEKFGSSTKSAIRGLHS